MTKKEVSKKTNKKNHTSQKGITLIALVITIIVMLILVAVTITVAINGGLFGMARKAKADTEEEQAKENTLSTGRVKIDGTWYDSMEDYVNGTPSKNQNDDSAGGGSEMLSYEDAPKDGTNETLTKNALWTEENGKTAVIPRGFKVVNGKDGDQSIDSGLVIEDAEGNQFVWIPVTYEATGELDGHDLDSGFLAVFYRSEWSKNARTTGLDADYTEPYASGYHGEDTDYYAMMKSVQDNGGFYIGRYEAGSTTPRKDSETTANGTTTMVVKRDQYPYNYLAWGNAMDNIESDVIDDWYGDNTNQGKGAVYLSKHMYDGKDVGVTSTLCYGVEWDAMLDFIKDEKDVSDSIEWGNYKDNPWTINRAEAKYSEDYGETWLEIGGSEKSKDSSTSILLTTGASDDFAVKNIYDVAGNCWEWTMEAADSQARAIRGGEYDSHGSTYAASFRGNNYADFYDPNQKFDCYSFRPALYIKN